MGGFSNATEQTRAKIDVLSRVVDKQKEKIRELQSAYNRAKAEREASQSAQHSDMPSKFIGQQLN